MDVFFFFQAEDGIRGFCLSRGLGEVYKGQPIELGAAVFGGVTIFVPPHNVVKLPLQNDSSRRGATF